MKRRRSSRISLVVAAAASLLTLQGCATISDKSPEDQEQRYIEELQKSGKLEDRLAALELRSRGRLGFAIMDSGGVMIAGYRAQERFAMCSTFKMILAAQTLRQAELRKLPLRRRISYGAQDLLEYAPVVKSHFDESTGKGVMTVEQLARASVVESDNSAANLLLGQLGGPAGLTEYIRTQGDLVTRLDRIEPALNENGISDPRDTTSPAAMVALTHKLLLGKRALRYSSRQKLISWLIASPTGADRLRAGLPEGWMGGSKSGSCGNAVNDVAIAWDDDNNPLILAVFLDRPGKGDAESKKTLADVAALVTGKNLPSPVAPK